nr:hypothetical protein [Tanacetum cinerariifolium]
LGLVAHFVANMTHNTARSCMMYSTSSTQGKVSSIPTVLSWIDNISSDGFLPFILLVVVIMVPVIVAVVLEIVVVVIVGVVNVVTGG